MVRNGAEYAEKCITHLIENEIEVAIIDHSSDDGTYEICQTFSEDGLCFLKRIEYPGYFSWEDILKEKYQLTNEIQADWVIHQDIDECLESPIPELNLNQSIQFEDGRGHTVINFNEFVFLPYDESVSFYESPYYYFFESYSPRLMRAWKKNANFSGMESGGHQLEGDINLSPTNYNLRHYVFTSQEHAFAKYSKRAFPKNETDKGWHRNRINIPLNKLVFPDKNRLNKISPSKPYELDSSNPWKKHYWE
jgi:hypothetical protein